MHGALLQENDPDAATSQKRLCLERCSTATRLYYYYRSRLASRSDSMSVRMSPARRAKGQHGVFPGYDKATKPRFGLVAHLETPV